MPWRCRQLAHRAHVRHRYRLAAGHVHRGREADVRDALGADLLDQRLERLEVDVALERAARRSGRAPRRTITSTKVPPASSWCSRVVVKYMLPGT